MKTLLIIFMLITLCPQAYSIIHFEPILGLELARTEQKTDQGTYQGNNNSYYFGARGGSSFPLLSIGVEAIHGSGNYGNMSATHDTGSSTQKGDESYTNFGPFLMLRLPIGINIWGTYYMVSQLKHKSIIGNQVGSYNKYKGTGISTGAGYVFADFISLNFDVSRHTYDKWEHHRTNGNTEGDYPATQNSQIFKDLTKTSYRLSVSFPIVL